jgi:tetratricopeptide (TPR) repeat protein
VGQGQADQAVQAFNLAEALLGPEPFQPMAEWWQGWGDVQLFRLNAYYTMGRWREMARVLDKLRPIVEQQGAVRLRGLYLCNRVVMAMRRDRYVISDETLADARDWLAMTPEAGDRFFIEFAHYLVGWLLVLRGEFEEAEKVLQTALGLTEQTRNLWVEAYVLNWLAMLWRRRGQVRRARHYASRALKTARAVQHPEQVGLARAHLAWVAWREGNLPGAEEMGRAAQRSWQRSQWAYAIQWTALWPLLAIALEGDRIPEALDHARAMLDPMQQRLPADLEAALEKACQMADAGQPEAIRVQLRRTVELAQGLGYL